jgi:hypothetical protein
MNHPDQNLVSTFIISIRNQRVLLDADLARIYGVTTARLNQQVKRNLKRFPQDFMFQLNQAEFDFLMSQIATSKKSRGGRRKSPRVFTEHGAVMLASVLNSSVAVEASIQVVRAFIHLRQIVSSHADLARKINGIEQKYDRNFKAVFDAIRQLMKPPPIAEVKKRKIGINQDD